MSSEAIILAGGLGTRLKNVIADIPKPMAPIGNKPFLDYLFQYLRNNSIRKVILSVGHKHESITDYFSSEFQGITIDYSIEETPLGTGGAIRKALDYSTSSSVFILNGDTFFDVDLKGMAKDHLQSGAELTMAIKEMNSFDRYGTVIAEHGRIEQFVEKKHTQNGYINGGTYLLEKEQFLRLNWPEKFSFEQDYLQAFVSKNKFAPYISNGYFIDIGIPDDYNRANSELKQLFNLQSKIDE